MGSFIFPDYKRNILNISATLADFLGVKNDYGKLPILQQALKKDYKNIIFLILDGFGDTVIKKNLPKDNLIRRNIKQTLTSVFPSTTTSATTTLMSCRYPAEHGWLAWSLYFKELEKCIDIYRNCNTYDHSDLIDHDFIFSLRPFSAYYSDALTKYQINTVFPPYISRGIATSNIFYQTLAEMFAGLKSMSMKKGPQFIYAYCSYPDTMMHEFGVASAESKDCIKYLADNLENLHENLKDTLIIVTADHGHVDVTEYYDLFANQELMAMLEWPPFLEARATGFKVKKGKLMEFERCFNKHYKKDFRLFKSSYLIEKKVFGEKSNFDLEVLLGDFIAVGKDTHKGLLFSPNHDRLAGHHTSLTEEMNVPLILLEKK